MPILNITASRSRQGLLFFFEPSKSGMSYLYNAFGKEFLNFDIPFVHSLEKRKINLVLEAIDKRLIPHCHAALAGCSMQLQL